MKPSAFEYHVPKTSDEAVALLAELGEGSKLLAGGQSLIPMLALRLAEFEHLIDVGRIDDLKGIEVKGGHVVIGAGTTEAMVERSTVVADAVPLLSRATPLIGHFQIRSRGTIGGSIAHADPAAEYPAVSLALDAEMEVLSTRDRRRIDAGEFFEGFWSTAMETDEMLVSVRFPIWTGRCGFAVEEFARRHGDFAIAGAVVGIELDSDDQIRRCSIALIGLGPTPIRARWAEAGLLGAQAFIGAEEVGRRAVSELDDVPSDLHGSDEYRKRVGAAMVERAWTRAIKEAQLG